MKKRQTSSWRKLAISIYGPPRDGKVYGTYEIDASEMLSYIAEKKKQGVPLTVTNMVTAAVSRAMFFDVPEMNCFVRRGKLIQRDHVDVFIAVAQKGKNVTAIVIPKAEEKTAEEIAFYQREKLDKTYAGKKESFAMRNTLGKIPWPLRGGVVRFIKWWIFDNGFPFPFVKIGRDPFGSISISNIGTFGLSTGYLALFPIANLPAIIAIGKITEKPVVIDGKITIRPMLPVSGTFDHRIVEGDKIGDLVQGAETRLLNPSIFDSMEKKRKE